MILFGNQNKKAQQGFTVTELIVVFAIFVTLSGIALVQWNSQGVNRTLNIAKVELISNLRKIQNYTLSSRNLATNTPSKFYLLRVAANETTYTLSGVDASYNYYPNIETYTLPSNTQFADSNLYNIATGVTTNHACVFIIFSSPFGKMYVEGATTCDSSITNILQDLPSLATRADKRVTLNINHSNGSVSRSVIVNGFTGRIQE